MAKNAITEKALSILNYVRENADVNLTAQDIADALGFEKKSSVDGAVTQGLQKRGLTERVPATVTLEDGTVKPIKFIKATEAGMAYDHAAAVAADAQAAAASSEE